MPTFEFFAAVRVIKEGDNIIEAREAAIMSLADVVYEIESFEEVS